MKWSVAGLVLLGTAAALCAAVLVGSINADKARANIPHLQESPEITVLIAKQDLNRLSVVEQDAFEKLVLPRAEAPKGFLSNPAQVVGNVLTTNMIEGQPFVKSCFAANGPGVRLATKLMPGMRAVTVSLADYAGLEGLLYPGCVVDVLATFDVPTSARAGGQAISTTLLQNIQVLAVENETVGDEKKETVPNGESRFRKQLKVTLMVDSRQAEALQLAVEHGQISLALRNPTDTHHVDKDATLLSEGRLAKLAAFLSPTVPANDEEEPDNILRRALAPDSPSPAEVRLPKEQPVPEKKAAADEAPPKVAAPKPKPEWKVTIFKGTEEEVRTFPLSDVKAIRDRHQADDDTETENNDAPSESENTEASEAGAPANDASDDGAEQPDKNANQPDD